MNLPNFIRHNMERILQEWENHAFKVQPNHDSMSKEELRDHAEKILLDIADGIEKSRSSQFRNERSRGIHPILGSALRSAVEHGISRHGFGFDINDVLSEYRALRTSVIRLWAESVKENPPWDEILLFNEELDGVITEAVEAFTVVADKQKWLLEKVITSSRDHCYLLNAEGKFIYANDSLLKDLKIENSALMGKTHQDLHSPGEILYREVVRVFRSGEARSGEVTYSLPSMGEKVYEYLYEPILDDQNRVEGLVALERDITERKRSSELLLEATTLLQAIAEGTEDLIAAQDQEFRYLFFNKAYQQEIEKTFGVHIEDGMSMIEMLSEWPEDQCKAEAVWRPALKGESIIGTGSFGANRMERTYDIRTFPLRDAQGQVFGAAQIVRNVTEQIRIQESLETRTEELAAANRELEAFSYSVSHDLRGPLRTINGFVSLLQKHVGQLDDKANEYVQRVVAGVKKMDQLIDEMLHLSRISRQEMIKEEVNLSATAKAVIDELEQQYPERLVETHIADDLKTQGDAQLIKIALTNLLGNAWKYTEKKAEARVEFGSCLKNEKRVFFVHDNGAGFSMKQANRLFKPFQRLHSESEFPGTGIGLPIVHRVVSRHGGEIWAEGEIDKGATFYFTLGSR